MGGGTSGIERGAGTAAPDFTAHIPWTNRRRTELRPPGRVQTPVAVVYRRASLQRQDPPDAGHEDPQADQNAERAGAVGSSWLGPVAFHDQGQPGRILVVGGCCSGNHLFSFLPESGTWQRFRFTALGGGMLPRTVQGACHEAELGCFASRTIWNNSLFS